MMKNNDISISTTSGIKIRNESFIESSSREGLKYQVNCRNNRGDIFVLARAFLSISSMTNKKLQKLCYYAKAWYLALYDRNLIDEQFQAWVHGAVQPALYAQYKRYGFENIPMCEQTDDIPEEFQSFAAEIYESYGHLTGDELEVINHKEAPWINARGECKPWEKCNNEISEEDMRIYYREKIE